MLAASLHIFDGSSGDLAGEAHACLGIEFQAPDSTPAGELVRLDYGANDDVPLAFQLALTQLGAFHEVGVGVGQLVRIRHDFEDARIVLALVPSHPKGADLHNEFSVVDWHRDGEVAGRASQECGRPTPQKDAAA